MKDIQYDYSKLKGRITEVLGSRGKLADEMGISRTQMSKKLNNKAQFSRKDINKIVDILRIPVDQIHLYFFKQIVSKN